MIISVYQVRKHRSSVITRINLGPFIPPPKSHSLAAVLLLLLLALYAPRLDVIHTLAASCTRSEVA